jgi:autotransporter-associated beta strand protein
MNRSNTSWSQSALALAVVLLTSPVAPAADGTWTQLTSGSLWSVGTNWSGGTIADGSGFTANFNTLNLTADTTVRLDSARTIGNLIFGDTTTATAGSWILDNNGTAGNILTLAGSTPTITVNALGTGKTANISAVIAGTSGLRKAGAGTLVLEGANTYTGATAVTAGILRLTNASALGGSTTVSMTDTTRLELAGGLTFGTGSTITINGNGGANFAGSLQSASGTNVWAGNVIIGTTGSRVGAQAGATLNISGEISAAAGVQLWIRNADQTGTTILSGNNTYNAQTTVLGRLSVSNIGSVGSLSSNLGASSNATNAQVNLGIQANTATLIYTGTGETTNRVIRLNATDLSGATLDQSGTGLLKFTANLSQDATAAGTRTLTLQGSTAGTGEFAGVIANAGTGAFTALSKAGSGTWTLSGANTFTGGLTISAGTLQLGHAGALNSTAGSQNAVAFSAGSTGTLSLNGHSVTISNLSSNATPGTPVVQNGNATSATLTIGNSLNASGTFAGIIQDGAGGGALTLVKAGSGTLTLSNGGNTHSGGTTLNDGTLNYGHVSALGSGTVTFSANAILQAGVTGTFANAIVINNSVSGTLDTQANNVSLGGVVSGAGSLVKAGAGVLTLSNSGNSLGGGITLSAGTLAYGSVTALGSGSVTFAANTTLRADAAGTLANNLVTNNGFTGTFDTQANNVTLSGDITGQGQLLKKGAGILYLAGTGNTFSGGLVVENANTAIVGPTAYGVVLMAHNAAGTGPLTIGNASTSSARFSLNGHNQTVSALSSGSAGVRVLEANGTTGGAVSTLTVDQSIDTSYTGFLRDQNGGGGVLALVKTGGGLLDLSGSQASQNYSGGLTVNGGTLGFAAAANVGTGTITLGGGTLRYTPAGTTALTLTNASVVLTTATTSTLEIVDAGGTVTVSGVISGAGTLAKSGAGKLTLSNAANSHSGGVNLSGGTLNYGHIAALGTGSVTFTGIASLQAGVAGSFANQILINNGVTGTFDTQASSVTASGIISGSGLLTKTGAGTLTLTNASNAHSGGLAINAGTVNYTQLAALGSGLVTFSGNATLQAGIAGELTNSIAIDTGVTGVFDTQANNVTLSGNITGQGQLFKKGSGILYLSGSGSTFSGGLLIENASTGIVGPTAYGVVLLADNAAGTGPLTIGNASTSTARFSLNGYDQTVSALSSGSVGVRVLEANGTTGGAVSTLTVNQAIDTAYTGFLRDQNTGGGMLALVKTGGGLLDLSGAQTAGSYSGGLTVNGGTLGFANTQNVGTAGITLGGGTLRHTPLATTVTLSNAVTLTDATTSSVEVVNSGSTVTFSNIISGSGAFTKSGAGTVTLNGVNTYSGATVVSAGALNIGASGRTGTGAVTVQNGGVLHGTGVVQGSSFTAQNGASIHAGATTAPESFGTLSFTPASGSGGFDFQSGSTVYLGLNPGGVSDRLNFTGTGAQSLIFDGNLTVGPASFTPTTAETFNLLDWSGLGSVTFHSRYNAASYSGFLFGNGDDNLGFDLPDISGGTYAWDISSFTTDGTISIVVVPEPSRMLLMLGGIASLLLRRRARP